METEGSEAVSNIRHDSTDREIDAAPGAPLIGPPTPPHLDMVEIKVRRDEAELLTDRCGYCGHLQALHGDSDGWGFCCVDPCDCQS